MATLAQSVKLTYEDYVLFPDDGKRHEIIGGAHCMTPAPNTKHQQISRNLLSLLAPFIKQHRLGEVFDAPYDVILSDEDIVQPDLLFVAHAHLYRITEQNLQGVPDLIVEILSSGTRKKDELTKRKLYERFGVQEYWIIDPELDTIKIYRQIDQGFAPPEEFSRPDAQQLTSDLFPDLTICLSDIFP